MAANDFYVKRAQPEDEPAKSKCKTHASQGRLLFCVRVRLLTGAVNRRIHRESPLFPALHQIEVDCRLCDSPLGAQLKLPSRNNVTLSSTIIA